MACVLEDHGPVHTCSVLLHSRVAEAVLLAANGVVLFGEESAARADCHTAADHFSAVIFYAELYGN